MECPEVVSPIAMTSSQILVIVCIITVHLTSADKTEVEACLYGEVILRCSFPSIRGPEDLSVVWCKKSKDGKDLIVHKFMNGQDKFDDQNRNYSGRTTLSKDFSQGSLDLTLRDVTFNDEGTYYCRALNGKDHGEKEVKLSINDLNAGEAFVTAVHIDGRKRLKCIDIGVFRNPWVRWYDSQASDLSEHSTRNITDNGDGRKKVESILNLDVERNKHYFCVIKEGRLKRTTRAVLSDGSPVTITDIKLPD